MSNSLNQPKDINDLRNRLLEAFCDVESDDKQIDRVREMTNTAGKILGTLKVQLVYAALRNERPEIEFLGKTSGQPIVKPRIKPLHVASLNRV